MRKKLFSKSCILGVVLLFFGASLGVSLEPLSCDANGPYVGNIMEDIEFEGTATGGIPPYEYLWDYGDGNTSSGDPHPTHNYANAGNYTVIFTVTDSINDSASDTTWAYINAPPEAPTIDGPNSGIPNQKYTFTFNSEDPDGDNVKYVINWGDGNNFTTNYATSGSDVSISHKWDKFRKYTISAKAEDVYGAESNWSEFEITIPRNKATFNSLFLWFLERFPLMEKLLNQMI